MPIELTHDGSGIGPQEIGQANILPVGAHPLLETLPRIRIIGDKTWITLPGKQGLVKGPLLRPFTTGKPGGITGPTPEQEEFARQFEGMPLSKVNLAGRIAAGLFGVGSLVATQVDVSPVSAQSAEEIQINQDQPPEEDEVAGIQDDGSINNNVEELPDFNQSTVLADAGAGEAIQLRGPELLTPAQRLADFDVLFMKGEKNPETRVTTFNESFKGHFYTQTRGEQPFPKGFFVMDNEKAPMWSVFKGGGGIDILGYPISDSWEENGLIKQAFQEGVISVAPPGAGDIPMWGIGITLSLNPDGPSYDSRTGIPMIGGRWAQKIDIKEVIIPPQASTPKYMTELKLPIDTKFEIMGTGARLETWERLSQEEGKSVWQFMIDKQKLYFQETGRSMPLPAVSPVEKWDAWAKEAGIKTQDLLYMAFYGDKPDKVTTDGPLERAALAEVNWYRQQNGIQPVTLNPMAVHSSRASAIYTAIQYENRVSVHDQVPNTTGFFGVNPIDRIKYFGARGALFNEATSTRENPIIVIKGFMESPAHKAIVLKEYPRITQPLVMGYAEIALMWPLGGEWISKQIETRLNIGAILQ